MRPRHPMVLVGWAIARTIVVNPVSQESLDRYLAFLATIDFPPDHTEHSSFESTQHLALVPSTPDVEGFGVHRRVTSTEAGHPLPITGVPARHGGLMPDNRFDGKKVSTSWDIVLTHARKAGVKFHLNSGRRTLPEQWVLFRQNMVRSGARWVQRPGHPLTAFPNPNAPHIRVGRQAHAIDVQTPGETALQKHLEFHGLHPTNPVPGEAWHLEVPEGELKALAKKLRGK